MMDEYYLDKSDWDTMVELGVGDRKDEVILKTIPTATKTAFTKSYDFMSLIPSHTQGSTIAITPRSTLLPSIEVLNLVYR